MPQQASGAEYVVEVLGGASVFRGRAAPTVDELRDRIKRGLPYRSFESVRERLDLTVAEAAGLLRMPPRTLARRRQTQRLAADESDRLYRVARVVSEAVSVFGSEEKAAAWLNRPNRALGGERPVGMLDTDLGVRLVEDVLGRLDHGIVG